MILQHFLYKTICIVSGRWYIGIHSTRDLNDGYIGSGKVLINSIRKHGRENHVCEILEWCPDRETLIRLERVIVTSDVIRDPMCMNLISGGSCCPRQLPISDKTKAKIRIKRLGQRQSEVANQRTGEASLRRFADVEFRAKHAEATRLAMKNVDREPLDRSRRKRVHQYDLNGNHVATFVSVGTAAAAVGVSCTMVSHVLNGRAVHSKGFVWKYAAQETT